MQHLNSDVLQNALRIVGTEVHDCLLSVPSEQLAELGELMAKCRRIFFAGEGRSGLVAKMAAMRMMHLGLQSFVVGETTTPSITKGDLLLVVSGSGETPIVDLLATKAIASGADLALITAKSTSKVAKKADIVVAVPAQSKFESSSLSKQFAGSLFEQTALLALDAVFQALSNQKPAEALMTQHANLE